MMRTALFFILSLATSSPSYAAKQGTEVGNGGDSYSVEFTQIGYHLADFLLTHSISGVDAEFFRKMVASAQINSTHDRLELNGNAVDAINYPNAAPPKIRFSRTGWDAFAQNPSAKVRLVFHEYLGLLKVDDSRYQVSHRLDPKDAYNLWLHDQPYRDLIGALKTPAAESGKQILVQGRGYDDTCGHFIRTSADFEIIYRNDRLPAGSTVLLISGESGRSGPREEKIFSWENRSVNQAQAISSHSWSIARSVVLQSRDSRRMVVKLDFVFFILLPDGSSFYDKGNVSELGHYEIATFRDLTGYPCRASAAERPPALRPVFVSVIEKNF
jgi:hypothetical protein